MQKKRLLFVDNRTEYFLSHRLPLALAAREAGYEVHVTTLTSGEVHEIETAGFSYHPVARSRRSGALVEEGAILANLVGLYRALQPDLVHHITLRSILYGGIAARVTGVPAVIDGVTGLGYLFSSAQFRATVLRAITTHLLRVVMRHPKHRISFQNPDDLSLFQRRGLVSNGKAVLIKGSGVDVGAFACVPEPETVPLVVLASRMLWQKGIREFVEAARLLKGRGIEARFALVGAHDPDNPASVPLQDLEHWKEEGVVEWWGRRSDMPSVFAQAHIVCLPSYYREGIPKVLIEAAACGRAIVTTDTPGCREIVHHGINGLLVPPQDGTALAEALQRLILDKGMRQGMGRQGRTRVEREFALEKVIAATLNLYEELN